jgi:hypothetical protein
LKDYNFSKLPKNSVFFMLAQEEEAKAFDDQVAAFDGVDKQSQGALIWFPEASHAIPDSAPSDAAYYLDLLIGKDPLLEQGGKYKNTSRGLKAW